MEASPLMLITDYYREQNAALHAQGRFGGSGHKHAAAIAAFAEKLGARTVLDYGCGQGKLKPALSGYKVAEYDPAIPEKAAMPKPADLLVCTDVLEHVEPECLDDVLGHMRSLALHGMYLAIALRLDSKKTLPDGRNPHLLVRSEKWWSEKTIRILTHRCSVASPKELIIWGKIC